MVDHHLEPTEMKHALTADSYMYQRQLRVIYGSYMYIYLWYGICHLVNYTRWGVKKIVVTGDLCNYYLLIEG